MTMTRMVDGKRVAMTAAEAKAFKAEQAKDAKPLKAKARQDAEALTIDDLADAIVGDAGALDKIKAERRKRAKSK